MLLGGLNAGSYDNTISIGQMKAETGQALVSEFKNYATNYYATGNNEIDLAQTLECLRGKKKALEREVKESLVRKQAKRERIEQEASYVWRDVHHLEEECGRIAEELKHRQEKEIYEAPESIENKRMIDELRPEKWRIHPVELIFNYADRKAVELSGLYHYLPGLRRICVEPDEGRQAAGEDSS